MCRLDFLVLPGDLVAHGTLCHNFTFATADRVFEEVKLPPHCGSPFFGTRLVHSMLSIQVHRYFPDIPVFVAVGNNDVFPAWFEATPYRTAYPLRADVERRRAAHAENGDTHSDDDDTDASDDNPSGSSSTSDGEPRAGGSDSVSSGRNTIDVTKKALHDQHQATASKSKPPSATSPNGEDDPCDPQLQLLADSMARFGWLSVWTLYFWFAIR